MNAMTQISITVNTYVITKKGAIHAIAEKGTTVMEEKMETVVYPINFQWLRSL